MEEKMKKIKAWLDAGYTVKLFGNYGTYGDSIVKSADGKYYHYSYFGSSAVQATEDGLNFVLTKIFAYDADFYIINAESLMECTNDEKAFYCNHALNSFTFSENPDLVGIWGGCVMCPQKITTTIADMIVKHYEYGETMRDAIHHKGGVHFTVTRLYTDVCGEFENFTFAL